MTWNRYGRGAGWDKLGEVIAMMARNSAGNSAGAMGGPGMKMRWRYDSDADSPHDGDTDSGDAPITAIL